MALTAQLSRAGITPTRRTRKRRVSTLHSMVKKLASLVPGVDISTSADKVSRDLHTQGV
jgi:hypothetical protein